MSGAPVFAAAATQGTPLDHLARVAYICGSHRTVTKAETVLNWLLPPGHSAGPAD